RYLPSGACITMSRLGIRGPRSPGGRAMLSVFCSPSRYTQGKGATAALGREMAALGLEGPALIIAGKTVIGRLAETWKSSLDEANLRHAVHRFGGECSLAEIERVKSAA